jgi:hypothetical protein
MSAATRRKIAQLRALAASTTFPEEAKSARAKADKLEAKLGAAPRDNLGDFREALGLAREQARTSNHASDAYRYFEAMAANAVMRQAMMDHLRRMMDDTLWNEMMGKKPEES